MRLPFRCVWNRAVEISNLDGWCRYTPLLHQILAGSRSISDFPRPTTQMDLSESCAVWETLHYLCRSLLGWQSPAHGMAWWYAHGRATQGSVLLETMERIWGCQNAIDYYAAWVWTSSDSTTGTYIKSESFPPGSWWDEFRRHPCILSHAPYGGGTNPLHLGHSDYGSLSGSSAQRATDGSELHLYQETRRGVLVVSEFADWREELVCSGKQLPALGERSWRIGVFDRQIGYLGEFRRSRVTGQWFMGRHGIHMAGNPLE